MTCVCDDERTCTRHAALQRQRRQRATVAQLRKELAGARTECGEQMRLRLADRERAGDLAALAGELATALDAYVGTYLAGPGPVARAAQLALCKALAAGVGTFAVCGAAKGPARGERSEGLGKGAANGTGRLQCSFCGAPRTVCCLHCGRCGAPPAWQWRGE